MALFDKLGSAQAMGGGNWWPPGATAITLIQKVIERSGENATRNAGNAVIIEEKVIGVMDPGEPGKNGQPQVRRGEVKTYMVSDGGKRKDTFMGNIKGIVGQLLQCAIPGTNLDALSDEEWTAFANRMCGSEQIFSGLFVIHRTTGITTRENKPFTRHAYDEGLSASQVRSMLAELKQDEAVVFKPGELDQLIAAEQAQAAQQGAA